MKKEFLLHLGSIEMKFRLDLRIFLFTILGIIG
jgi:hypothetical protein